MSKSAFDTWLDGITDHVAAKQPPPAQKSESHNGVFEINYENISKYIDQVSDKEAQDILAIILKNVLQDRDDIEILARALKIGPTWAMTKQKHKFWHDIHEQLMQAR